MTSKISILVALLALVLATAASAAPKTPTGTISGPNEAAPYAFGDSVTFTVTTDDLKGYQYPLVYVACSSVVDGELLYGQLDHPTVAFQLGGGSSEWHTDRDDANCTATLYAYEGVKHNAEITQLAEPVLFEAAG
jgi:hypothetical protein